ncbi:MAG TPA: hypothetical protein VND65_06290 [Candidatus Binatia bacterium]|nr:hypothetical protein [Candidatus Binatia bacterium]
MPDPAPNSPASSSNPSPANTDPRHPPGPTIHIADEFGTAKRNLPPLRILAITIGAVLIVVAIVSFVQRAKPQGSGSIDNIAAIELPGQNSTLAAITLTLKNSGERALWIHDIAAKVVTASGEQKADVASAVDFDRYYQAFPALKENTQQALAPEEKLQPGQEIKRTVIVSFPVTLDVFNQRKSLSVMIQPYDQPVPIVLTTASAK